MKCASCPAPPSRVCLGESVARLCFLASTRADYRHELARLAAEETYTPAPPQPDLEIDALLRRVASCPQRGAPLPTSLQPECGCFERTECREGRGARAGHVTLAECLACVAARRK